MIDKEESLKNILKNLLEERLSYLEKRNNDQMKDLIFETEAFKNQELLVEKLCSIKIELKKPPASKNNIVNKTKPTSNKSRDKAPKQKEIKVQRRLTPDISTRNIPTQKKEINKEKEKTPLTKDKTENKLKIKNPKANNTNTHNKIKPKLKNESKNKKKITENNTTGKRAKTADDKLKNKNEKPKTTNKKTENNLKSLDKKIEPKAIKDKNEEKIETQKNEKILKEKEEPEKINLLSNFDKIISEDQLVNKTLIYSKNKSLLNCFSSDKKLIKNTEENILEQKNYFKEFSNQENTIIPERKIIGIKLNSTDQTVNYLLACSITDSFLVVEKKLYKKYPDLEFKKIYFLHSGNVINRNATIKQNKIKHESVILIIENKEDEFYKLKEKIIILYFQFEGHTTSYIACNPSDKFEDVEEKLYIENPELKNRNLIFLINDKRIDKDKTLEENEIKDESSILIREEDEEDEEDSIAYLS